MSRALNLTRAAIGLVGDASGNVGVGTSSILGNSTLNANLGVVARTAAASGAVPYLQTYNGNASTDLKTWRIGGTSSGDLAFETVNDAYSAATSRLTLSSSGSLTLATAAGRISKNGSTTSCYLSTGDTHGDSATLSVIGGDSAATALAVRLYNGSYWYPFQFRTNGTMSVGGATPSTSGSGITFPATQSASTDANTLDDYEEGTWTPTLSGSSTNPTVTYHANNGGRYIKIGKMVYLQCYLRWTALTGGSVVALVGGLPFTTASTAQAIGLSGVTEWSGSFPTNATYPTPSLESGPGTTYLYILRNGPGTSSINMAISSLANADTYLLFGFCYEAST